MVIFPLSIAYFPRRSITTLVMHSGLQKSLYCPYPRIKKKELPGDFLSVIEGSHCYVVLLLGEPREEEEDSGNMMGSVVCSKGYTLLLWPIQRGRKQNAC